MKRAAVLMLEESSKIWSTCLWNNHIFLWGDKFSLDSGYPLVQFRIWAGGLEIVHTCKTCKSTLEYEQILMMLVGNNQITLAILGRCNPSWLQISPSVSLNKIAFIRLASISKVYGRLCSPKQKIFSKKKLQGVNWLSKIGVANVLYIDH